MDLDDKNIFCKEAQLTAAMLFDGAEFTEPRIVKIGLVLELLHIQKTAMVPWSQFTQWIEKLFHTENVNIHAVRQVVTRLHEQKLKLQKDPARKSEVIHLLEEPFSLPQSQKYTLPHKAEPAVRKRSPLQPIIVQALHTVNKELASELQHAKAECITKDQQLKQAQKKLSEYNPHNLRRRLNRKDKNCTAKGKHQTIRKGCKISTEKECKTSSKPTTISQNEAQRIDDKRRQHL